MSIPTRSLNNGLSLPVLGLGTWKSPENEVGNAVEFALTKAQYTHIDCAKIYGNEKEIGQALHRVFSAGNVKREDISITSKLWNTDHDPSLVERTCRQTLADLQLEYLDVYLIHWGIAFAGGNGEEPRQDDGSIALGTTSLYETWRAMEELVDMGLVKSIGVANYSAAMLTDVLSYAKVPPAINQIELHPYNTQQSLVDYCHQSNVAVTAYSPLGNKSRITEGDPVLIDDPVVVQVAQESDRSPAQVLLRWAIQRNTIVIPKSVTPTRISENIDVFDFELSQQQMQQLSALNQNHRFVEPSKGWGVPYFA